ncbi:DUF6868 family protein [Candidatus Riflebacteria bacterium]
MWCTIINSTLLAFWAFACRIAPNTVYQTQKKWCPISQETFTTAIYSFLGIYKALVLIFNTVPFIVLMIMDDK